MLALLEFLQVHRQVGLFCKIVFLACHLVALSGRDQGIKGSRDRGAAGRTVFAIATLVVADRIGAHGEGLLGGSFTDAGGITANRIAMWNGQSWSPLGSGVSGGVIQALVALDHRPTGGPELFVGGAFTVSPAGDGFVARWRGCPIRADLNADGVVDLADFNIFVGCMAGPDTPYPAGCDVADLQADGDVDVVDFAEFQLCFSGGGSVASTPASLKR